jgi:hypothetical protein
MGAGAAELCCAEPIPCTRHRGSHLGKGVFPKGGSGRRPTSYEISSHQSVGLRRL